MHALQLTEGLGFVQLRRLGLRHSGTSADQSVNLSHSDSEEANDTLHALNTLYEVSLIGVRACFSGSRRSLKH